SKSASAAKSSENTAKTKADQTAKLHGEAISARNEVRSNVQKTESLVERAKSAADSAKADTEKTKRDREAVSNLRDDVETRQNKVSEKHREVRALHDATKLYRDEAQLIAGKAENYLVDYGDWEPKLGLPPKPATSARWKARKGGEVEGLGLFRAGDWLNYSVVSDKFYREGNVLSVNGRTGDLSLDAGDVGALPNKGQAVFRGNNMTFTGTGEILTIGHAGSLDSRDAHIRIGNATYGWKLNYKGTSTGEQGNEFQVVSTHTDKGYQIDHEGNFELLTGGGGKKKIATTDSDITGNAKTATTASNARKLNGRADHYHPDNKPTPAELGAAPVENAFLKKPVLSDAVFGTSDGSSPVKIYRGLDVHGKSQYMATHIEDTSTVHR
ncbi:hypothetical protein, partial [Salinivibrio sp. VYel6]|uniref:hypothetical protein n=1 Tax=Salinivibrio sp. VYel6 TaxID=2490493 RepID=UPI001561B07D